MRNVQLPAIAVVIGLTWMAAGCAPRHAAPARTGPPATGSAQAARTEAAKCGRAAGSPGRQLTLSKNANGKVLCVSTSQHVWVYLNGTPSRKWSPIHSDSSALKPTANGRLALMLGETAAYFTAVRSGVVHVTSKRNGCAPGGTARCAAPTVFRVTVVITRVPG